MEQREKAALRERGTRALLRDLAASDDVSGAVALSTCNRTEIYASGPDPARAAAAASGALVEHSRITADELVAARYLLHDDRAAAQLFRVASSLDSMVIGESEIQGQVRRAWEVAAEEEATGTLVNHLFRQAVEVGKEVRSSTRIGAGSVSISAVAVDLARATVGDLSERSVLVIGAGRVAEAAVLSLLRRGVTGVTVANRTASAAWDLAARVGGHGVAFEDLPRALGEADIVISSTDAPHVVVGPDAAAAAMADRCGRAMVVVDISVPRDVDARVGDIDGVTLFDIDDLARVADANLNGRRVEAEMGEHYVAVAVRRFATWRRGREAADVITTMRARAEEIRRDEVERFRFRWDDLSSADRERVERITIGIVGKLLHEPTLRVRAAAEAGDGACLLPGLRRLFGVESAPDA